jgi:hypothetical protein
MRRKLKTSDAALAYRGRERRPNLRLDIIFGAIVAALLISVPGQSAAAPVDTAAAIESAAWNPAVTLTFSKAEVYLETNDIPNHPRDAYYAVPNVGVVVPTAATATVVEDPTKPQSWRFKIPTSPQYATETTAAPLGSIGVMTSGSVLFNPYEGDNTTIAMANNFTITSAAGITASFVDQCAGHPTPTAGEYHYHGLPVCFASQTDPSKIIGFALDGFPIYGPVDISRVRVPVTALDPCNGITSPTPEFPNGIYHYVLPDTSDATSSIRCFHGVIDVAQIVPMPAMGLPAADAGQRRPTTP